ncbi:hypothetical protein CLV78_105116 [Aliiruegeria haliotis]|uniref:LPS sulfotransferase NodH n=1 Tax=Aliiruegeria haliotis TaxID=1280846 RepID=A0A2T0RPE6_9RHOB|nr:nodulation protein NodH [Aliiruegeria haliotis]PRY23064.1 hypothetical protein CLV78_105116 [Aliiruegeria haliotis]
MADFEGFVLFAEMRTGSNFLEESLNLFPGLCCHGEAFNPVFVGQHNWQDLLGVTLEARQADPMELLRRIRTQGDGLGGFRFFHDHDPRILETILPDPKIAKIILTRNPLESYVSRKIAGATGQWRLTDEKHRKSAKIRFDPEEFEAHAAKIELFQRKLRRGLQLTGQTAFEVSYEEVGDVDVLNGLGRFLGQTHRLDGASTRLKRQNPSPLEDKVENFEEMQQALGAMNARSLVAGHAESPQMVAVPGFIASSTAPLLFMPIKGGPTQSVRQWLAAHDDRSPEAVQDGFTRKTLRQWKNRNKGSRAFTIVTHPVERAYGVFEQFILTRGPDTFDAIRRYLRDDVGLPLPDDTPGPEYPVARRHAAFLGFLQFAKANLAGQTPMRTDAAWRLQAAIIQSMGEVLSPDMIIRADQAEVALGQVCLQVGLTRMPAIPSLACPGRDALVALYDAEIEAAARSAFNRDYMAFGFRDWAA